MIKQGLNREGPLLPKAGALPDCATPRNGKTRCVSLGFLVCRREQSKSKNFQFLPPTPKSATKRHQKLHQIPALFAAGDA